jgi:predicted Zn-dependent protease
MQVQRASRSGRAYLETGDYEAARRELSRSVASYKPFDDRSRWNYAWYYLARAHEGLENRGEAAAAYCKFLSLWGNADRSLPEVRDAKARLAGLES